MINKLKCIAYVAMEFWTLFKWLMYQYLSIEKLHYIIIMKENKSFKFHVGRRRFQFVENEVKHKESLFAC